MRQQAAKVRLLLPSVWDARLTTLCHCAEQTIMQMEESSALFFGIALKAQEATEVFVHFPVGIHDSSVVVGRALSIGKEDDFGAGENGVLILASRRTITFALVTEKGAFKKIMEEKQDPPQRSIANTKRKLKDELTQSEEEWQQLFAERLVKYLKEHHIKGGDKCYIAATPNFHKAVWVRYVQGSFSAQHLDIPCDNNEFGSAVRQIAEALQTRGSTQQQQIIQSFTNAKTLAVYGGLHTLAALHANALKVILLAREVDLVLLGSDTDELCVCTHQIAKDSGKLKHVAAGVLTSRHYLDAVVELLAHRECNIVLLDEKCHVARTHVKNYGPVSGILKYSVEEDNAADFSGLKELLI